MRAYRGGGRSAVFVHKPMRSPKEVWRRELRFCSTLAARVAYDRALDRFDIAEPRDASTCAYIVPRELLGP